MLAPAALRCRVTASLSASEMPSTGAGIRADPPPESSERQRSSGPSEADEPQNLLGAGDSLGRGLIDARRPGGVQVDPLQGPHAIGRHVDPTGQLLLGHQLRPERFFDRLGHAGARLSGPYDDDSANLIEWQATTAADFQRPPIEAQRLAHQPVGSNRLDAGLPDLQCVTAELTGRTRHLIYSRRTSTFNSPALSSNSPAESLIFRKSVPVSVGERVVPRPTTVGCSRAEVLSGAGWSGRTAANKMPSGRP